jgi:hypothetical protein
MPDTNDTKGGASAPSATPREMLTGALYFAEMAGYKINKILNAEEVSRVSVMYARHMLLIAKRFLSDWLADDELTNDRVFRWRSWVWFARRGATR